MKIAVVSKLWEKTDSYSTGGTGASVGNLVNGLVKRGHQVTLFATGDSKTKAKLISVVNKSYSSNRPYSEIKEYENISNAFQHAKKFDIIHCHVEHKSLLFSNLVTTPILHTLRYGEFFNDEIELLKKYKKEKFAFNSNALAKKFKFLNNVGVVYNGLDLSLFPFNNNPKDYLLFLGRVSPQKGPEVAIEVARKTGKKLIIAGKMSKTDQKFLDKKVLPYIENKEIKYLGEVNFKQKISLLKNALVLLHPISFFEACSNSVLEAQACGTPVLAFDQGSNSELIKNNKTGIIVKTKTQMIKAVKDINKLNRSACRENINKNFSIEKMVIGYEEIYKKIRRK